MPTTCRLSLRSYAPQEAQPLHEHDHVQVSVVLRGGLMETVGGVVRCGAPLSVVIKSAGVAHTDAFGPAGATILQLALPLEGLEPLLDEAARAVSWRWMHEPAFARPFLSVLQRMDAPTHSMPADDPDLCDILAVVTARPAPQRVASVPAWLRRVHERLEHDWSPHDTVASLATDAGVHPVYLARAMRRWYGHGVAEQLRRGRSRAAARRVADGVETLSRVAYTTGYADEAHLCREFGQTVGLTPGRYRRLVSQLST